MQKHKVWLDYKAWMIKAHRDLKTAKKLLHSNDLDFLDAVAFHTQQCAEKSLKAFVAYKNLPIQKVHDLVYLVQKCVELDASFEELFDAADNLNPYCFKFRYPDDLFTPDFAMVEDAVKNAEMIFNFISDKIAELSDPNMKIWE